ncbi:ORF59 [Ranid herpesvirus 2]|uniref:ORF59 n=1 Tax=Ranid herpesvirus 2 TaxID=389214 RepID=Q14W47_9VIRU|nr:ORF59 [Ranid herpesvirus 2]ABG25634.1 ORF59 [Ranid herpesvirus 2]
MTSNWYPGCNEKNFKVVEVQKYCLGIIAKHLNVETLLEKFPTYAEMVDDCSDSYKTMVLLFAKCCYDRTAGQLIKDCFKCQEVLCYLVLKQLRDDRPDNIYQVAHFIFSVSPMQHNVHELCNPLSGIILNLDAELNISHSALCLLYYCLCTGIVCPTRYTRLVREMNRKNPASNAWTTPIYLSHYMKVYLSYDRMELLGKAITYLVKPIHTYLKSTSFTLRNTMFAIRHIRRNNGESFVRSSCPTCPDCWLTCDLSLKDLLKGVYELSSVRIPYHSFLSRCTVKQNRNLITRSTLMLNKPDRLNY